MMKYIAHSAKNGYSAQTYAAHVKGVCDRAVAYAKEAEQYAKKSGGQLEEIVRQSAVWHDLGKLDDANQRVLNGKVKNASHLPVNHVDAGSAALLKKDACYAALAVYSHHHGLPDMVKEKLRRNASFRDEKRSVRAHTDGTLETLIVRHNEEVPARFSQEVRPDTGDLSVFLRMLLSCLADADHADTAMVYGKAAVEEKVVALRAEERLKRLDSYVAALGKSDERSCLRSEMYTACRDADIEEEFSICDSPVGSGKTTAVMAHLLKQAQRRHARRIFVVLPYTSIIQQSVDVYRKALVLPGEDPEMVVAELHCRAEFQNADVRYLTALWRAPIVVTTAVTFFETLASCRPAAIRRLHELPGSVIFIDESHNALPVRLLPLAWKWMNVLAEEWSCYWVLASGSLARFWELQKLQELPLKQPPVAELVGGPLRERLMQYEENRIRFLWDPMPKNISELISWVVSCPGPRLLIVNTIQMAAVLAKEMAVQLGREHVEHLSTALTPEDREKVIDRIKNRLADETDRDWTLVATSCVEAGVDFSFRTGFRELSSLLSLVQASGRVNRHGKFPDAQMWSFVLQDNSKLKGNPALDTSRMVLKEYFTEGRRISPELSTKSLHDELKLDESCITKIKSMMEKEESRKFPTVDEEFTVIDSKTVLAVIDQKLLDDMQHGKCTWRQLQRKSVSIRAGKDKEWRLKEAAPELYLWTLAYDSFLGYMRGVLEME